MGTKSPSEAQLRYLKLGHSQAGGKLPLFDRNGQQINPATIRSCIKAGWAEPWFVNPIKKDWLVCKLTDKGFNVLENEAIALKK
ncbi:hypothetical protein [Sneathiella aquimaris]|uniref:hypothetical protein n=1 Tax=Sneathiella aquimaris TaxID=2599305 RepID=UPI00146A35B6|nr:hypothetical protein [Sneathiella aquimaris]